MHVPHGWIDLEPMFLESHGDVVVLDCLGDRGLPGSGVRASTAVASPSASRWPSAWHPGPGGRLGEVGTPDPAVWTSLGSGRSTDSSTRWIDEGAEVSLLREPRG